MFRRELLCLLALLYIPFQQRFQDYKNIPRDFQEENTLRILFTDTNTDKITVLLITEIMIIRSICFKTG